MLQSDLSPGPFRKGGQGGFLYNLLPILIKWPPV